jgi:transketolase
MGRRMSRHAVAALRGPRGERSEEVDLRAVTTLRLLAADVVEHASSGHPGLPMGMAAPAYVLWTRIMRHDPRWPQWPDRDRFVLSAGHGSALLYGLLHLCGYSVSLEDLKAFRRWGSRTPGHPEYGATPGVETTTGPLGQGLATAVGLALAERMAAARLNRPGAPVVVDHRTFVLCSDGDVMEGLSHEAASLAGHLGLGRLVVLYDDNRVSIDGPTTLALSDDVVARFSAYGWQVAVVPDSEDLDELERALLVALADQQRPSLLVVQSRIGFGAPTKEGTAAAHGAPLGPEELDAAKRRFGWPSAASFHVPPEVRLRFAEVAEAGARHSAAWRARHAAWATAFPELAAEAERIAARELPGGLVDGIVAATGEAVATRAASARVLAAIAERLPELVGGSADLTESTGLALGGPPVAKGAYGGRRVHFGVREHAMAAAANGLALHGGFRPVVSTFLVFSDYLRPALRLSALMGLPVVYVFSHDSVAVGEDGPTHQPVEHLAALRALPGLAVLRPADAFETVECWRAALERRDGPTALVLSRQALPVLGPAPAGFVAAEGARVVRDAPERPDVVLLGTGSEVSVSLAASSLLAERYGVAARVVSVPWRERFVALEPQARAAFTPAGIPCLVVEAGVAMDWPAPVGSRVQVLGIDRFGASGPGSEVLERLGLGPERVAEAAAALVGARPRTGGTTRTPRRPARPGRSPAPVPARSRRSR